MNGLVYITDVGDTAMVVAGHFYVGYGEDRRELAKRIMYCNFPPVVTHWDNCEDSILAPYKVIWIPMKSSSHSDDKTMKIHAEYIRNEYDSMYTTKELKAIKEMQKNGMDLVHFVTSCKTSEYCNSTLKEKHTDYGKIIEDSTSNLSDFLGYLDVIRKRFSEPGENFFPIMNQLAKKIETARGLQTKIFNKLQWAKKYSRNITNDAELAKWKIQYSSVVKDVEKLGMDSTSSMSKAIRRYIAKSYNLTENVFDNLLEHGIVLKVFGERNILKYLGKMLPYIESGASKLPLVSAAIETGVSASEGKDYIRTAAGAGGEIAGGFIGYDFGVVVSSISIGIAVALLPIEIPGAVAAGIILAGALFFTYLGGKDIKGLTLYLFDKYHLEKYTKPLEDAISNTTQDWGKHMSSNPDMGYVF